MVTLAYQKINGKNIPIGPDEYTVAYLESLDTISQGQTHNLKLETNHWYFGSLRYYVSRCGKEDGETFRVYIEQCKNGQWIDLCRYAQISGAVDYVTREYGIDKHAACSMIAPY